MTAKEILKIVPILQSTQLLGENIKFMKMKKKKSGDFVKTGIKNIVGTELIKTQANVIEGLE